MTWKCTLVQALKLCTGRTAHRGCRCIALPFHDHGTRRGWGVSVTPRPLFTPGKDPVPILQETGWDPGPVWTGAENLASTGIRSPDCCDISQYVNEVEIFDLLFLNQCAQLLVGTYKQWFPTIYFRSLITCFKQFYGLLCAPYSCLLFKICNALVEFGLYVLTYLVPFRYLISRQLSVWPMYEQFSVVHF